MNKIGLNVICGLGCVIIGFIAGWFLRKITMLNFIDGIMDELDDEFDELFDDEEDDYE